jgi:hypothetical protein
MRVCETRISCCQIVTIRSEQRWQAELVNLTSNGWSLGHVSTLDSHGRIADAHRDNGKRFIVRADEKLTAFLELQRAVCIHLLSDQC